jgi:hypothetical protein
MSEQEMLESMEQELKRHLAARYDRNNEDIGLADVVKEAAFMMAVNILISDKQLREQTNGQIQFGTADSSNLMWRCLKKSLNNIFGEFPEHQISQIKDKYDLIMKDNNAKSKVNEHYNELYGSFGGDVI